MKKFLLTALVLSMIFSFTGINTFANPLPINELNLYVKNIPTGDYYLDLLVDINPSNGFSYDSFNTRYPESYKELPLYKYKRNGLIAYFIRKNIMQSNLEYMSHNGEEYRHIFRDPYNSIPKDFKVIIQYKSGELFVSDKTYAFSQYYQNTYIDFQNDMIRADVIFGDLNGDSRVDSMDYILLKRYVLGTIKELPSLNDIKAADVNGDGNIDSIDCILIKRHILGIIAKFPIEELR